MNEHYDRLEPVDPTIHEQLTRRSSGRLPDGLATQVSKALDGAAGPRSHSRWPSLHLTAPRLAGTTLGIAFVAVLAVALVAPALRSGPGTSPGYPYGRALTTDELAALMANPPAINTALVVTTTIDVRNDVCPMNRYPTAGVIHGVTPMICVMQSGLPPQLTGTSVTGTFAVRYLGPGYVGLLGQITPASGSQIPFRPTDEWPVAGKTFLAEGWLGADELMVDCSVAPSAGDPLSPNGFDCQYDEWLGDASTAPGIGADHVSVNGANPSYDPMSLRGGARHVEAGGMRLIDSLNPATPVHGVYVVRSITEQCPNASPQDSRGCGAWLVMAKVADMPTTAPSLTPRVIPSPSASPSPSSSPVTGPLAPALTGIIGPGGRPLTSAELDALWAANPSSLVGRIAIVKGPIPLDACPSAASAQPSSGLCVDLAWSVNGYWAVRVEPNGSLTPVGQLPDNNGSPLPLSLVPPVGTKQSNDLVLVDAYLDWMPSLECDMLSYPPDSLCDAGAVTSVLTSAPLATQGMAISYPSFPADDYGVVVAQGAYQIYGSSDLRARPIHGLFLMRGTEILARMVPTGS